MSRIMSPRDLVWLCVLLVIGAAQLSPTAHACASHVQSASGQHACATATANLLRGSQVRSSVCG